uniref:Transmembrane protein 14C n=1 Tax=Vannella robusta TaxID=1487602 RepID=A0A7S4I411_9EUKA|mmetsp:Transcript_20145/g.25523  ORF Transcript_20145/g.25523 Transcript_20145/m.25523 type:complete len:107 (+) Transcript_20145:73-393(+)
MSANVPYSTGLLVFAGGVLGYISKKSRPSLVAGSVIGLGLMFSGYLIDQGNVLGQYTATTLGAVLTASMAGRATTLAPVPVVLTCIGATVMVHHGLHIYHQNRPLL